MNEEVLLNTSFIEIILVTVKSLILPLSKELYILLNLSMINPPQTKLVQIVY